MIISRSILLKMRNVSDKSCRENKYILCSMTFFFCGKSCRIWDNMEEYCRAGQATDDNMAHVHCMLDTKGYRHTIWICNTLLFHCSSGCTSAPHCYVLRALPVLKCSFFGSLWTAISDEANSGVQGVDIIRLDYKEFNGETWGKKTTRMT
jgi:hypothetical protein